jgi:ribosomal protein S5
VQKQTTAGQRTRFKCYVAVGEVVTFTIIIHM